ncbi:hypothetical protein [Paenibacillus shenyangensis]|uniref:hypothetical protein n=1 Tax=Paenibacillus sp. A9 TaxID=1284352 RepID=UPI00037C1718|nr:hypothetical protein [Paenibacillus sp. A9]
MAIAYLDKSHVLHVIEDKNAAARDSAGKLAETGIFHTGGYPLFDGKQVVYYADSNKAYVDGNKEDGKEIPVPDPIKALIEDLK